MLTSRTLSIFMVMLLSLVLGVSLAETADKPDSAVPSLMIDDNNRIDVGFEEFALPEVVRYLAEKGSANIVIDPASKLANFRVTANLQGVTWLQVLSYLADKYEFEIEVSTDGIYTLLQPRRIDLVANKAPLREVIRQIADEAGFNVVLDKEVEGDVTAYFKQVPWTHALNLILTSTNFVSVKERYNVIRVTTVAKLKEEPEIRVFRLSYLEPSGATYEPEIDTKYATKAKGQTIKPASLVEILEGIVGKEGLVKYESANNALIVRTSRKNMDEVAKLIEELDREPLQVSINVRIYSVSLEQVREMGVKWAEGLIFSASGGTATNAVVFPFTNGFDSWEKYLHGSSTRGPFFAGDPVLAGGTLNGGQLAATLKLLETYTNAEVVQQPTITTLDNHAATIHVGDVIRYAEFEQTTSSSGGSTGGYKEAGNSPVELGVQLLVVPHVARRDGNVLMTVIPKIEDARGGSLFEEFGAGSTAIKLPQTRTESVVSKMIVPNGNTGVLAGFVKEVKSKNGNKIPLLGDIPGLGWLFKNRYEENTKNVLLIFITPEIISSTTSVDITREFERIRDSLQEEFIRVQKDVVEEKVPEGTGKVETEPEIVPEAR